jgi:hypothetical protein
LTSFAARATIECQSEEKASSGDDFSCCLEESLRKMVWQRSNKETIDSIGRRWCKALQMGFNGPWYRIGLAIRD